MRAGARAGSPRGSDRAPLRCPTAVPAWVPGSADPAESCRRASAAGMSPARRAARNSVGDPVQFIEVLQQTGGVFLLFQQLDGELAPSAARIGNPGGMGGVERLSSVPDAQGTAPAAGRL